MSTSPANDTLGFSQPSPGDCFRFVLTVKEAFRDNMAMYSQFLAIVKDLKDERNHPREIVARVEDFFQGYPTLLDGFHRLVLNPNSLPIEQKPKYKAAIKFVHKVERRFADDNSKFFFFIDLLKAYRVGNLPKEDIVEKIEKLFDSHFDLLEEFRSFIYYGASDAVPPDRSHEEQDNGNPTLVDAPDDKDWQRNYLQLKTREARDWSNYLQDKMDIEHDNEDIDKLQMDKRFIQTDEYFETEQSHEVERAELLKEEDRGMDVKLGRKYTEKEILSKSDSDREREMLGKVVGPDYKSSAPADNEELKYSKEAELDLSNYQRCTPSYSLLPKNYQKPCTSMRTELGKSVLNDTLVSVTSGSEDCSFKLMPRNQYEELLFRCEDDRYGLEMLLEFASITVKRVEEFLNKIQNREIDTEAKIQIGEHLSAQNLRFIEGVYGEHGLEVAEFLCNKPSSAALAVILTRLRQKQEEWLESQSYFQKVWADVYAKYHKKSLDHRSLSFKQQDLKNLSPKALLAEVREINDKIQDKNEALLASSCGSWHCRTHEMEFEYPDEEIHEDIYRIIEFSCGEMCTSKEQHDKVMKIWNTLLEPMLKVTRFHGLKDTEENEKLNPAVSTSSAWKILNSPDAGGNITEKQLLDPHHSADDVTQHEEERLCKHKSARRNNVVNQNHDSNRNAFQGSSTEQNSSRDKLDVTSGFKKIHFSCGSLRNPSVTNTALGKEVELGLEGGQRLQSVNFTGCNGIQKSDTNDSGCHQALDEREEGEITPAESEQNYSMDYEVAMVDKLIEGNFCTSRYKGYSKELVSNGEIQENDASADNMGDENARRLIKNAPDSSEVGGSSCSECGNYKEGSHKIGDDGNEDNSEEDAKAASKAEIEETADAESIEVEGTSFPISGPYLHALKPLREHTCKISHSEEDSDLRIFYGNNSFYVLFRLHQILYERILSAKTNSLAAEKKLKSQKHLNPPDLYAKFKGTLYSLLEGFIDNSKYEDDCLSTMGCQSYVLFTLDKLIHKIIKQLQAIASSEMDNKFLQLYEYESSRKIGTVDDLIYYKNTCLVQNSSIFRFECLSAKPTKLLIQLMEHLNTHEVATAPLDPDFAAYLDDDFLSCLSDKQEVNGVLLRRNKCKLCCDNELSAACKANEGISIINGLECNMNSSSKVRYVMATEDFLFRAPKEKKYSNSSAKSENFRSYLLRRLDMI